MLTQDPLELLYVTPSSIILIGIGLETPEHNPSALAWLGFKR